MPHSDEALDRALRIQARGRLLLKALERAADAPMTRPGTIHETGTTEEAALAWLKSGVGVEIPPDELEDTARYFATYLDTSYDYAETPASLRKPNFYGCACGMCAVFVRGLHLTAKKLHGGEKAKARLLMAELVDAWAKERDVALDAAKRDAIVTELKAEVALLTYIEQLFLRIRGFTEGPAVLALWRTFAWTPEGSPRKDFSLTRDLGRSAESALAARLSGRAAQR